MPESGNHIMAEAMSANLSRASRITSRIPPIPRRHGWASRSPYAEARQALLDSMRLDRASRDRMRQSAAVVSSDSRAIDTRPDTCWRCDAAESETNVGLCSPCHQALTA